MDNPNSKVLNKIYENAALGSAAIEAALPAVADEHLSQELKKQQKGYTQIADTAEVYLAMSGLKAPRAGTSVQRAVCRANIVANLAAGRYAKDRATELLIENNVAGVDTMRSQLSQHSACDSYIQEFAHRLVSFEEENIAKLSSMKAV